jgi:hypothetical protein
VSSLRAVDGHDWTRSRCTSGVMSGRLQRGASRATTSVTFAKVHSKLHLSHQQLTRLTAQLRSDTVLLDKKRHLKFPMLEAS